MKKDLIAKHALGVFARDGYHNAKVKTIAEEAGIAVGTITSLHFCYNFINVSLDLNEFHKKLP